MYLESFVSRDEARSYTHHQMFYVDGMRLGEENSFGGDFGISWHVSSWVLKLLRGIHNAAQSVPNFCRRTDLAKLGIVSVRASATFFLGRWRIGDLVRS